MKKSYSTLVLFLIYSKKTLAQSLTASILKGPYPVINFTILEELYHWPLANNWSEIRKRKLEECVRNLFVIPYDAEICRKWAEVTVEAKQKGRPLSLKDA